MSVEGELTDRGIEPLPELLAGLGDDPDTDKGLRKSVPTGTGRMRSLSGTHLDSVNVRDAHEDRLLLTFDEQENAARRGQRGSAQDERPRNHDRLTTGVVDIPKEEDDRHAAKGQSGHVEMGVRGNNAHVSSNGTCSIAIK